MHSVDGDARCKKTVTECNKTVILASYQVRGKLKRESSSPYWFLDLTTSPIYDLLFTIYQRAFCALGASGLDRGQLSPSGEPRSPITSLNNRNAKTNANDNLALAA